MIKHVILALSARGAAKCDMSYKAIYVALSHVKKKKSIRLLMCHRLGWESLSYIMALEPDQYVKDFFSGFVAMGDPDGARKLDIDLALKRHNERIRSRRSK
jgi:hypothetical protein